MNRKFTPKFETTLATKLRAVRGNLKTQRDTLDFPVLPSPMSWKKDGEDHINIWHHGSTIVGAAMSHYSPLGINHPQYAHFACVDGFWQWVVSRENDDRLRVLTGNPLRSLAKKMTHRRIPNLRMVIMAACWLKVQQHNDLAKAIKTSTLPFDCYYHEAKNKQLRIRPYYANWYTFGFEEIRKALKERREPDFEKLREVGHAGDDIYGPLNQILYPPTPETDEDDDISEAVESSDGEPAADLQDDVMYVGNELDDVLQEQPDTEESEEVPAQTEGQAAATPGTVLSVAASVELS